MRRKSDGFNGAEPIIDLNGKHSNQHRTDQWDGYNAYINPQNDGQASDQFDKRDNP